MATRSFGAVPLEPPRRLLTITVDGVESRVPEGSTILDACRAQRVDTPTLCFADNLTPINACRVCVVEVEGARTLVPACSRAAEDGMKVATDTERVRRSRNARAWSSWHRASRWTSRAPTCIGGCGEYEAHPERFGAIDARAAGGGA